MPLRHPPLTWSQVLSWAAANEISDDLPVCNQEGELLNTVRLDREDLWLGFGAPRGHEITWGRLKEIASTTVLAGDHARLIFDDYERGLNRVVDLGESLLDLHRPTADYGEIPVFVLQRRWG